MVSTANPVVPLAVDEPCQLRPVEAWNIHNHSTVIVRQPLPHRHPPPLLAEPGDLGPQRRHFVKGSGIARRVSVKRAVAFMRRL
jgi:hypothetical protein